MRRRVARAQREASTVVDQPTVSPPEFAPPSLEITMAVDPPADRKAPIAATLGQDQVTRDEELDEFEGPLTLEFLEPSSEPGSLGRLGHHEVLEVLGRGGFGIVVRAFDESLHRMVAIKVLDPRLASSSPRGSASCARPAPPPASGTETSSRSIPSRNGRCLTWSWSTSRAGRCKKRHEHTGPLELADVLRIGAQIARGLAAAHEEGLIHRDIKPANILLESDVEQNVKITDFGLARAADDASLTRSGGIVGTPLYMAPEQAKGGPLDPRTDLFSLGSVLYTMASGRPPFRAPSPLAVLKRVAEDTPRPIRQIIPEVPQWLCDLIAKLHAKDPAHRFQSAAEVATLLEQRLAHLRVSSIAPPEIDKGPRRPKLRRAVILAAAAAAVVLGGLGTVITPSLWRRAGPVPIADRSDGPGNGGVPAPARRPPRRPRTTFPRPCSLKCSRGTPA